MTFYFEEFFITSLGNCFPSEWTPVLSSVLSQNALAHSLINMDWQC